GEAAAPRVEGRAGEAAAATLDGRRRHPRRPSSVSVLRPFRPSAEPTALPCRRCGRSGPQRSRPPSTTPIELRAADAQAHPRHAPGRRGTVVADDSAGQYRTWSLLLSNCPHRPPSIS
ncbi:unnamed protein product, partial [Urochloa humidicola]